MGQLEPGVERVEGGDYGGPSKDWQGPRCGCHGKVTLLPSFSIARWEITPFNGFTYTLYKGSVNGKSRVVYDEVPNPAHAAMNTYATTACSGSCAYADRSCNTTGKLLKHCC